MERVRRAIDLPMKESPYNRPSTMNAASSDKLAPFYKAIYRDWRKVMMHHGLLMATLLSEQHVTREEKIIDLAAGVGTQSIPLRKYGYNILSFDASINSLVQINGQPRVCGAWQNMPFADESFDVALMLDNSLPYVADWDELRTTMKQCARILKPSGKLFLSLRPYEKLLRDQPARWPIEENKELSPYYHQYWKWLNDGTYEARMVISGISADFRFRAITQHDLVRLAIRQGFSVLSLNGWYQPLYLLMR